MITEMVSATYGLMTIWVDTFQKIVETKLVDGNAKQKWVWISCINVMEMRIAKQVNAYLSTILVVMKYIITVTPTKK